MTLNELADAVEKAEGPSRELDAAIEVARDPEGLRLPAPGDIDHEEDGPHRVIQMRGFVGAAFSPAFYTSRIDDAIRLVPKDWAWRIGWIGEPFSEGIGDLWIPSARSKGLGAERCRVEAATPVLALCAAALRARALAQRGVSRDEP